MEDMGPDRPDPQQPHVCYPTDPDEPRRSLCRVCLTPVWRIEQLENRWAHQFTFLEPRERSAIDEHDTHNAPGDGPAMAARPAPADS